MKTGAYLREVEAALQHAGKPTAKEIAHHKHYKSSKLDMLGLTVPQQRAVYKKGFSFQKLPAQEVAQIWDGIWHESNCYEVMSQALLYFENPKIYAQPELVWPILRKWVDKIENWAHSDSLSGIYAHLLERDPERIYPTLVEWNTSKHPWKRRQSVVSLFYYFRVRKKVLPSGKIVPLVRALLKDEDYFVQKGVGWTLRELEQAHSQHAREFIEKHLHEIHPAAWYAAVEKFSKKDKERLKLKRRAKR